MTVLHVIGLLSFVMTLKCLSPEINRRENYSFGTIMNESVNHSRFIEGRKSQANQSSCNNLSLYITQRCVRHRAEATETCSLAQ